jgi:LysR family glycine cleavage system transcriptional activator
LELTETGRELLPELSRGFDHFERAIGGLKKGGLTGRLFVSAMPSFANLWLVPRLNSFLQAYPDIQVRILAAGTPPDLGKDEVDLRIPYGLGSYPGFKTDLLMGETVFPVCAPSLLNNKPLRRFSDLRIHTLLHDIDISEEEPTMTWKRWLRDAGVSGIDPTIGVEFGDSLLLTEAAVRGQGVALGRIALVRGHLASGRLIRPLKISRPGDYAYYTVTTQAGAEKPRVRAFINWLRAQVENDVIDERPV